MEWIFSYCWFQRIHKSELDRYRFVKVLSKHRSELNGSWNYYLSNKSIQYRFRRVSKWKTVSLHQHQQLWAWNWVKKSVAATKIQHYKKAQFNVCNCH